MNEFDVLSISVVVCSYESLYGVSCRDGAGSAAGPGRLEAFGHRSGPPVAQETAFNWLVLRLCWPLDRR